MSKAKEYLRDALFAVALALIIGFIAAALFTPSDPEPDPCAGLTGMANYQCNEAQGEIFEQQRMEQP